MFLTLNPESEVPLFTQLHDAIVSAIAHGGLRDGDKLDPVRRVAADFGINPATVKKAYDKLVAEGLAETAGRSGTVVRPGARTDAQNQQLDEGLTRVAWLARAQGFTVSEIRDHLDAILKELP
ncbi:GntR family transcriptional regulator [Corynebacterium striatum]|uniref:GntR family transcriptional regulator n=1 Tax=Corynebacterium striatum TaxID=43770 RepID=UPI000C431066|nr:GntR family transcriptional regulator [Corynebacterium striatum]PIS62809.1 GntR family transcriptional regulator [Corynebacterium striatum]PXY11785.1 GntR family transcriptional regulator [Corynebacterium striatum]